MKYFAIHLLAPKSGELHHTRCGTVLKKSAKTATYAGCRYSKEGNFTKNFKQLDTKQTFYEQEMELRTF